MIASALARRASGRVSVSDAAVPWLSSCMVAKSVQGRVLRYLYRLLCRSNCTDFCADSQPLAWSRVLASMTSTLAARVRAGDGPLSVRARPSSIKRDCARRTTSTDGRHRADVHTKSRLTLEPNADTPVRDQGPGQSLPGPDAGHPLQGAGSHRGDDEDQDAAVPGIKREWEPRWEPRIRTTFRLPGRDRTVGRAAPEVTNCSEHGRTAGRASTDQKAGGSEPLPGRCGPPPGRRRRGCCGRSGCRGGLAQDPLAIGEGAFQQRDGLGDPPGFLVGDGEVVAGGQGVGVVSPSTRSQSARVRSSSGMASAIRPASW